MTTHDCKRCGKTFGFTCLLVNHLNRKTPCLAKHGQDFVNASDLLKEIEINEGRKYTCIKCLKKFKNRQSKYVHQRSCTAAVVKTSTQHTIQELSDVVVKMQKNLVEIERSQPKHTSDDVSNLLLELQYYKNRRNEDFYQRLLEQFLKGTHKVLPCGVTDVTTDDCHAEIKRWNCWKEAVGQLKCYNSDDPRQILSIYAFGNYIEKRKNHAIKVAFGNGIKMYEFVHADNESVQIKDLSNNVIVYTYNPTVKNFESSNSKNNINLIDFNYEDMAKAKPSELIQCMINLDPESLKQYRIKSTERIIKGLSQLTEHSQGIFDNYFRNLKQRIINKEIEESELTRIMEELAAIERVNEGITSMHKEMHSVFDGVKE